MTPLEAIIKNVIMMLLAFVVLRWYEGWSVKHSTVMLAAVGTAVLGLPFIINPVDYSYNSNNLEEKVNYPLELEMLYQPEDTSKVQIPSTDLRKGKQIVAFLSLTCSHCRIAAKKFRLIKKSDPSMPIYFILNGDKSNLEPFLEDTRADNIPYSFCLGKTFVQLASARLPRIYYLDNSIVVKKVDYFELNQYDIEQWLTKGR
jgi:hypothetical protein